MAWRGWSGISSHVSVWRGVDADMPSNKYGYGYGHVFVWPNPMTTTTTTKEGYQLSIFVFLVLVSSPPGIRELPARNWSVGRPLRGYWFSHEDRYGEYNAQAFLLVHQRGQPLSPPLSWGEGQGWAHSLEALSPSVSTIYPVHRMRYCCNVLYLQEVAKEK